MKIEANDKEVQDIFSLGYFKIPRFQRPFSWESDEVECFWNDAINDNSDNYFIGSMVVYQTKKPYFGIVDGQQRLTTITLILSSIRNAFLQLGEDNLAKGVHKYIEQPNIDNEDEFILKSETSFPYLQDHIQSFNGFNISCEVGAEEQKLEIAFNIINSKINSIIPNQTHNTDGQRSIFPINNDLAIQTLKKIRDKVLSLKLVFIQLDNEDDAYLIFETLNARGRDLTTADLVKNLILKKLKTTSVAIDQAKESWNSIVRNFDDSNDPSTLDSFLLHYWVSENSYTTDKKLFSEVRTYVDNYEDGAKILINKLNFSASLYSKLLYPDSHTWTKEESEIKKSIKALNIFKVKQQSAMTLSLLRAYSEKRINLRNLKSALNKIEAFHYCFNAITSQRSSGAIASNYSKLAIDLSKAQNNDQSQLVFNELDNFLSSKLPDKKEFIVKFLELSYSSRKTKYKNIIKYTLSKLTPLHGCLPVDTDNLTIEHILSESSSKFGSNDDIIANIGNLILVDSKTNSDELSNKSPTDKLILLSRMEYPMSAFFIDNSIWNADTIHNRAESIATHIYDICYKTINN